MTLDPRERRRHRAPDVSAVEAAVRLEASLREMRERAAEGGPARPDDEPPTGLIDLNAIRARLGQPVDADPDPAAVAWLAGGPDPAAARMVARVDRLEPTAPAPVEVTFGELYDDEPEPEPEPVEHPCEVLGNAYHSDGPCGPQHPAADVADLLEAIGAERLQPAVEALRAPEPAPEPEPEPVFSSEQRRGSGPRWRSRHDERSRLYGARARLASSAPLSDRLWPVGPMLDQGSEGACVGFGIVDALNARAAGDRDYGADDALELFRRADTLDGDGLIGQGTSVLAGLTAAVELGMIGGYLWCFGTRDIAQTILQRGPVVLGLPWLEGMATPGPGGLMTLDGEDTGLGHCLAAVGLLLRGPQSQLGPFFVLQNSYDVDWGDGGLGYLHHRDLAAVLHGVGEAALPTLDRQEPRP